VIYGVISGLSLAMDIHFPEESNSRGVILVPGSAWDGRELGYTEYQLKSGYAYVNQLRGSLVNEGFTVFVPNTRMSPEYRYPAPVEDVRRAVRFVRHNASSFGIDPNSLAAVGHSSGGYLAAMAGVLDDDSELQGSKYDVERASSRIRAVVTIASPFDLTINTPLLMPFTVAYIGERPPMNESFTEYLLEGKYAEASVVTHVTADDAAFLLIHGSGDPNVSLEQQTIMANVLRSADLDVETILIDSDSHTPTLNHNSIIEWLNQRLLP